MIIETVKKYTTAIQQSRDALLNGDLDLAQSLCNTAYDLKSGINNTLNIAYWQLQNQLDDARRKEYNDWRNRLDQTYDKEDDDTNP